MSANGIRAVLLSGVLLSGALALGACSSDSKGVTNTGGAGSTTTTSPTLANPPADGTGLKTIDGPAQVDPSFTGANNGGG